MTAARAAIGFAMLVAGVSPAGAQVQTIRSSYSVSLIEGAAAGPVESASGTEQLEVVELCNRWSFAHDMTQLLRFRDGRNMASSFAISGVESRDSRHVEFSVRLDATGNAAMAYRGSAEITGPEGGRLRIEGAAPMDLPPGTLFPNGLALAVLEQGRRAATSAEYFVLDGAFDQPRRMRFVMQPVTNDAPPQGPDIDAALLGGRSWRLRAVEVDPDAPVGAQAREVSGYSATAWVFESGVTAEYTYDYGAFAVRVRLERLAVERGPGC
jgi:hypothetical protein